MKHKFSNIHNFIIPFIIGIILFWSAFYLSENFIKDKIYDFMVAITAKKQVSKDIVVVAIDDQSINKIGRWPWKRTSYTDIFEYLENYGQAKVIAFDSIINSYGGKDDDKEFFDRLSKLKKVIPGMFFSKQKAYFINNNEVKLENIFKKNFSITIVDNRPKKIIKNSKYLSTSYALKEIMNSVSGMGSVLSNPDEDGIIRHSEPVFYYKNSYYPSLALATFNKLRPESEFMLDKNSLKIKNNGVKTVNMPLHSGKYGSYNYIKWYKSNNNSCEYPYKTISAWKILESYNNIKNKKLSLVSKEELKDKIIFLGVTSTALKDIKLTPMSSDYPGVYIQATLTENLLNNEFINKFSNFENIIVIFAMTLLTFLIVFNLPALYSCVMSTLLALTYFSFCLFIAYPNNYAPDAVTPILFVFCAMLIGYGYRYFAEDNKKREIKHLIAKYVSKDILDAVMADVDSSKLGGKRADVSILFADIRNFTSLAETLEPEAVSGILNEYFSEMIPVIFSNKGTVNKFIGDALLVIFGAPVENSEHPKLAVKCATEMLKKTVEMKEKWQKENKPLIEIGIGISSGIAFVGNIGSDDRHEYSAIGSTVNIASRLESFNKLYKTNILISEYTYERVKEIIEAKEVDSVCVTQNSEPMKIYEVKSVL